MKRSVFALAVIAVALPSFAFAGEPVPMSDKELDNVAAGILIGGIEHTVLLRFLKAEPERSHELIGENSALVGAFIDQNRGPLRDNDALIRSKLPESFWKYLPTN